MSDASAPNSTFQNRAVSAGPASETLLETQGLSKNFGGVKAVTGIDFRLGRGELRCLIGPNGAGKSTFFKMLKNQVPSVWDGLSVYEHFFIAAHRRLGTRRAAAVADELLTKLGLAALARRDVGALAHGERQWVEIGMTMAQDAKLILLDEPTAGMATDEVERTVALLRAVNVSTSLIIVEHDMQFISMIAGIVTVFHQGRILIEDTMENVLANPAVREVYLGAGRPDR